MRFIYLSPVIMTKGSDRVSFSEPKPISEPTVHFSLLYLRLCVPIRPLCGEDV